MSSQVFLSQLPAVAKSIAPDTKKLISAAAALSKLAANEDLEQQAAAISKSAIALEAGIKKQDTKVQTPLLPAQQQPPLHPPYTSTNSPLYRPH